MRLDELEELHNITPWENLPSILSRGIISHTLAKSLEHKSVAMSVIQDRRASVVLPNNKPLHAYANLYFNGRNKMMYCLKDRHEELSVVRVDKDILNDPTAVITDMNASSDHRRFGSLKGL